ncbi:MAG: preprotein translocase subunit YajC [Oscillospiraceae bacterium]|nr:preprotein translocase subunit YajC [Oscillospiraceae bacterium]
MSKEIQVQLITLAVLLLLIIFMVIVPSVRGRIKRKKMLEELAPGDTIFTDAGVKGKVTELLEDTVIVEIGTAKTRLEIAKWGIRNVMQKAKN